MIKLKNIIELIHLVWTSKQKRYLVLATTTNLEIARITVFDDFKAANKRGLELMRSGDVTKVRIVLEITSMDLKSELKK